MNTFNVSTNEGLFSRPYVSDIKYFSSDVTPYPLFGVKQFTHIILTKITRDHDVLPDSISRMLNDSFSGMLNGSSSTFDPIKIFQSHWSDILHQNTLLAAMFVFGIVAGVLLPLSGIVAGLKHFCFSCLNRKKPPLQKNDKWMFWLQGLTSFFLISMGWIGVAWLNESNLAIQDGLSKLRYNYDG